ncbi:MAG: hypothetical protein E7516_06435 [Ruminococcaceae bacterium]|nr:hypothetical protein [Oscillospiraceae bacterium]
MLYKKNSAPTLSDELFMNPTCEYRGTPFWAWNSDLKAEELCRQIEIFKKMGLGGFHMHVRTGMSTNYLSDEFMSLIKCCCEKADKEHMLAWLYDEDRWPSGAAGGLVTKDEEYRARCLLMTTEPCDNEDVAATIIDSRAEGGREGKGWLINCYDIILDENGFLKNYKIIGEEDEAEGTKWYAYLKIHAPSPWYNNQTYLDTLNPKAVQRFVEVTHERYKQVIGESFGGVVPAIFTDEPQFTRKDVLDNSTDKDDITMPWTDDLPDTYMAQYGEDILSTLPEIFWELPDGKVSTTRYHYHDHISERFAEAFADVCGSWCRENGIALTGHMMEEPSLHSQTAALGDAMRSYRGFDLPGIDMLCANFEFTTAKQAQSAVHQYGREGMLSELYGVTGWDYDFRGYKLHGDWQACLGVTIRVPHLSWYAMGGEAKRDYPASIHYQSPWWEEFSYLEDHFARVNTAMTRGKPVVKVGVIHPVESFWLHWGPNDKTALIRENMDQKFQNITDWLLKGSIDFNFISESLLPSLCEKASAPLQVGEMTYDAVIVPDCETLRSTTLECLEAFRNAGGKLIFLGNAPKFTDGIPDGRGKALYEASTVLPYDREKLLNALDENRTVTLRMANGRLSDGFIYQLRQDGISRWLFISRCKEPYNKDCIRENHLRITISGEFTPYVYDTICGNITPVACEYIGGNTVIAKTLYDYDSLLLRLDEGKSEISVAKEKEISSADAKAMPALVPYTLSERNAYLLDIAEFALDGGEFMAEEEILRLDNVCREMVGFVERGGNVAQPWVIAPETIEHHITLRFRINSEIDYSGAELALEDAEKAKIVFNGNEIANNITGWYTDKDIKTVPLTDIVKGENILEITLPFGTRTNTEWCYILGDFGVKVIGREKTITNLPEKLGFGTITNQGLPFYGGNITYHLEAEGTGMRVEATRYRGALISVAVDGEEKGKVVYPPYLIDVDGLADGKHKVDITLFGNRYNAFGPVHLTDVKHSWHGPGAWRSDEETWSYEYVLRDVGILARPVITVK